MEEDNKQVLDGVVSVHRECQTKDAKWLCIENIFEKFYRPNTYDIGSTYVEDLPDFRFLCQTEIVGDIFLLHLFISNHYNATFSVDFCFNNDIKFEKKTNNAYITEPLQIKFEKTKEIIQENETDQHYIHTYSSFSEIDVDNLNHKRLYISIHFPHPTNGVTQELLQKAKLRHDFRHLLSDPVCSDFIIESVDGEKFNVHKVILTANSEVFKAMLKDETAESQNNYVKLVDVPSEDLKYLLEFIYTGTITGIENANLFNLLMLADRYDLDALRQLIHNILAQELSEENVFQVLIAADMYNSEMLKYAALKFIKKHITVLQSKVSREVRDPDLLKNILEFIVPIGCEHRASTQ